MPKSNTSTQTDILVRRCFILRSYTDHKNSQFYFNIYLRFTNKTQRSHTDPDARREYLSQRDKTGVEGAAGGEDVVDKKNVLRA